MAIKVKLRSKPITGNRLGLYLDFYPPIPHPVTDIPTRREFLNMFLHNEFELLEEKYMDTKGKEQKRFVKVLGKNRIPRKRRLTANEKQHNVDTLKLAEQIKVKRENQLNKPEIYTGYERNQLNIKKRRTHLFWITSNTLKIRGNHQIMITGSLPAITWRSSPAEN